MTIRIVNCKLQYTYALQHLIQFFSSHVNGLPILFRLYEPVSDSDVFTISICEQRRSPISVFTIPICQQNPSQIPVFSSSQYVHKSCLGFLCAHYPNTPIKPVSNFYVFTIQKRQQNLSQITVCSLVQYVNKTCRRFLCVHPLNTTESVSDSSVLSPSCPPPPNTTEPVSDSRVLDIPIHHQNLSQI